jgi:hypothetical protein
MTNLIDINEALGTTIEDSAVGNDNALSRYEGLHLAEEITEKFLVMFKKDLPEVKVLDTRIYVGNQSLSLSDDPEETLLRALSYLAAAAKLTELKAEKEAARLKDEAELLAVFNSVITTPVLKRDTFSSLNSAEKAAAEEIRKLRNQLAKIPLAG